MSERIITISLKRYYELIDAEKFLQELEAEGVDNWEGYELAREAFDKSSDE